MAKVAVNENSLINIGDAIREKLGVESYYKVSEMASAIRQIHGEPLVQQKTISQNGTYSAPVGVDGFNPVIVQTIPTFSSADNGKVVSGASLVSQTSRNIASNGTYDTTQNNEVIVDTDSDATLSSGAQMLSGVTAYARGNKYTGAIPMYNGSINSGQGSIPSYDYYEGSYVIVPSTVSQAFPTAGKIMSQNLQVESYSTISADPYSGSYVITPSTVSQSFPMAGKLMESDLIVEAYSVDTYDGSYIATPTFASQAFPTAGKMMSEDFVVEGYSIDYYSGSYSITPSTSAQLLDTVGKTFSASLRIYGYSAPTPPVYNGSYVIEPSVSQRILSTSGKMMQSDLTIEPFTEIEPVLMSINISENGTYHPSASYEGFSQVIVNIDTSQGGMASLLFKSITSLIDGYASIPYVPTYAFAWCQQLSVVDVSACSWIGVGAFVGCTGLTSISAPQCQSVSDTAFGDCIVLESVSFPLCSNLGGGVFEGCSVLKTVNLPLISSIPTRTFAFCGVLSDINIPCTSIGSRAFYRCNIQNVSFPLCEYVDNEAFYDAIALSVDLPVCSWIGFSAFRSCQVMSISLPACESICADAFDECYRLSYVNLPSCKTIGAGAFHSCSSINYLSLPACESIGRNAFFNYSQYEWTFNTNLTRLDLPACKRIDSDAFYGNPNISIISAPLLQDVGGGAFHGLAVNTISFPQCSYFAGAAYCSNLTTVSLPVCKTLGNYAFETCSKLQSVELPQCEVVNGNAFWYCQSLQTVKLPVCSVFYSGYQFYSCSALSSLYLLSVSVVQISSSSPLWGTPYSNNDSAYAKIYVPSQLVSQYKNHSMWSYYSNCFVGI